MYENQLEFIKPHNNNNSFSGVYYSDILNNDFSNNNFENPNYENHNESNFYQNNHNGLTNQINPAFQKYLYIDERNKIIKQNEINNEVYARNQHLDYLEQLDYMNQHSVNIFPDLKPTPLVYNGLTNASSNKNLNSKKRRKSAKNPKKATWDINKNFLSNLKNRVKKNKLKNKPNPRNNIVCLQNNCKDDEKRLEKINFNFNANVDVNLNKNAKGLFDPNLKSNELDFPRKTVIQRLERMEKIKNYDVKFGSKVRKLEVYNNIMDMFEDLALDKEEKDFRKKEKSVPRKGKVDNKSANKKDFNIINYNLMHHDDTEDLIKENKSKYKTNLDFNFSEHEQMIKALEQQITQERKLRAEVNFKYLQKMKELEENKIKDFIQLTAKSLSKSASRSKSKGNKTRNNTSARNPQNLFKVYLPEYDLIKDENKNNFKHKHAEAEKNKFKNNINNSIDVLRKQNKLVDTRSPRVKSEEAMKIAIDEIKPGIDRMIEQDFQKIINKDILLKSKSKSNSKNKVIKKLYVCKSVKRGNNANINIPISRRSLDMKSEFSNNQKAYINYSPEELNNYSYNPEHVNRSVIDKSQKEHEFNNQQDQFNNSSMIGNERLYNYANNPGMNQNSLSLSNFNF